jgi:hypothetical protein
MQKIAASVFAAVTLHGCGEADKTQQQPAIRGQPTGVSSSDIESLKNKAKKKAQQFVKTAHLNGIITQGFQAMKKSGLSTDQIATGTDDLKKYAVRAQHEILKGEKSLESVIPEYKDQVVKLLSENKAGDFVKQMETYTKTLSTTDFEQEANHMLKDTHMFNAEQLMSFNNFIKSTIHQAQQSMGSNPFSSKAVKDLTKQMGDAQSTVVSGFEKAPLKQYLTNALEYEQKLYAQMPYDQISNGAKQVKNNLNAKNVNAELSKAQKDLEKLLK